MPRIRTIKPEFWGDEKLAPLDPLTRLVFLGLVSMADDAGRLLDNIKSIDGFLFPETGDSSRDALEALAGLSRITRYTLASGQRVIQIANWTKHQKVDKPSRYALPAKESRDTREEVATASRDTRAPILDLGPRTLTVDPDLGPGTKRGAEAPSPARKRARKPAPEPPGWAVRVADRWISRVGAISPAFVAKALGPFEAKHGEAALLRAIDGFADARSGMTGTPRLSWFVDGASMWVDRTTPKPVVDSATGLPNERGMAILSGAR